MNYTLAAVLALTVALAGSLTWASVTEAPWESEPPTIVEVQPTPDGPSCDALYLALAQAPLEQNLRTSSMSEQAQAIQDAIRKNGC